MSETEGKAGESMDEKEQGAGPNQTVLIAIDESNRAEDAFDCEYTISSTQGRSGPFNIGQP